MSNGGLAKAIISAITKDGSKEIECKFNPYEYTISKSNTFDYKPKSGSNAPSINLSKSGPQTLKLKLIFDGYDEGKDIGKQVHKLWDFMDPKMSPAHKDHPEKKVDTPFVTFKWGLFSFESVITSMTQKYTLFKPDGTPVRAEVDITFVQHIDTQDYPTQNPTSGRGPTQRVWQITEGDRIDLIAADVYGDATKWTQIATYNDIVNPHQLRVGSQLSIPPLDIV